MDLNIILEIVLIGMGVYLVFFKSYFHEKGKNLATSEDIEDLTYKVESVKQQFIEKNASLKANLELFTNLQINKKNDERIAIINFHKKIKYWIGLLTEASPALINDYDNKEINSKIHSYETTYKEVLNAEAVLELYINDEKLFDLIHDLKCKIFENLGKNAPSCLINLKQNNFHLEQLENEQDLEKKATRHKELIAERKNIYDEYRKEMLAGLKTILPFENEYTNYIKNYLKTISEE